MACTPPSAVRAFSAEARSRNGEEVGQEPERARLTDAAKEFFKHGRAVARRFLENVPCVPTVAVEGYHVQRIDADAREFGLRQRRRRHFQYGSREGRFLTVARVTELQAVTAPAATCMSSEGWRTWAEFCELQGLPRDFELPSFTKSARYQAVGNGVPLPMARAFAVAVRNARLWHESRVCQCGCGREIAGKPSRHRPTTTQAMPKPQ
jgi:DNA (cytosine-5)-methyltransferase 1